MPNAMNECSYESAEAGDEREHGRLPNYRIEFWDCRIIDQLFKLGSEIVF